MTKKTDIAHFLDKHHNKWFTVKELCEKLNIKNNTVSEVMKNLYDDKKVRRKCVYPATYKYCRPESTCRVCGKITDSIYLKLWCCRDEECKVRLEAWVMML